MKCPNFYINFNSKISRYPWFTTIFAPKNNWFLLIFWKLFIDLSLQMLLSIIIDISIIDFNTKYVFCQNYYCGKKVSKYFLSKWFRYLKSCRNGSCLWQNLSKKFRFSCKFCCRKRSLSALFHHPHCTLLMFLFNFSMSD